MEENLNVRAEQPNRGARWRLPWGGALPILLGIAVGWESCYGQPGDRSRGSDGPSRTPDPWHAWNQPPGPRSPAVPATDPPRPDLQTAMRVAIEDLRSAFPTADSVTASQNDPGDPRVEAVLAGFDRFAGVEDVALERLTRTGPAADPPTRGLCLGLLRRSLRQHWTRHPQGTRRDALDHAVRQILEAIPGQPQAGRDLAGLLVDQPFLGVAHEQLILDLTSRSGEQPEWIPTASDLLLTLWRNLCAAGARTSRELTHLALLFRVDTNRSRRLAALRFLLTEAPRRFRDLALHEILTTADGELASQLTMAVATGAPTPEEGLETLQRLSSVAIDQLLPALVELEERQPGLLGDRLAGWPAEGREDRFYRVLGEARERCRTDTVPGAAGTGPAEPPRDDRQEREGPRGKNGPAAAPRSQAGRAGAGPDSPRPRSAATRESSASGEPKRPGRATGG